MITEEQRRNRKKGLGGSDIAAICGANPYKSPHAVYMEKTSDNDVIEDNNINLEVGNACEPLIAQFYMKQRNRGEVSHAIPGIEMTEPDTFISKDYPFLFANVDRMLSDGGLLEIKTAVSYGSQKQWRQGIPEYHRYQIGYYAKLLDAPYVDVAVLCIGEKTPRYYRYERNHNFELFILDKAIHFWNEHVLKKVSPCSEMDFTVDALQDSKIHMNAEIEDILNKLQTTKTYKEHMEEEENEYKNIIINYMGTHNTLIDKNNNKVAYILESSRQTFNSSQFKKEHPDMYQTYMKKSDPVRSFRLVQTDYIL